MAQEHGDEEHEQQHEQQQQEQEERRRNVGGHSPQPQPSFVPLSGAVELNVGGQVFLSSYETLRRAPQGSVLAGIAAGTGHKLNGLPFVDGEPQYAAKILGFLRSRRAPLMVASDVEKQELLSELATYGLQVPVAVARGAVGF